MFSRRVLRIKALQQLFLLQLKHPQEGLSLPPEDLLQAQRALASCLTCLHELHWGLIQLLMAWAELDQKRLLRLTVKKESLLTSDPFYRGLTAHPHFLDRARKCPFTWPAELVEGWYVRYVIPVVQSLEKQNAPQAHQQGLWKALVSKSIFSVEEITDFLWRKDLYWQEDKYYLRKWVEAFIGDFMQAPEKSFAHYQVQLPAGEELFYTQLVKRTIAGWSKYDSLIAHTAANWELSRLAPLDLVMIKMALTEIMGGAQGEGPSMNVVLSEYLSIARLYSTPKSPGFINGVVAAIVAQQMPAQSTSKPEEKPDGSATTPCVEGG